MQMINRHFKDLTFYILSTWNLNHSRTKLLNLHVHLNWLDWDESLIKNATKLLQRFKGYILQTKNKHKSKSPWLLANDRDRDLPSDLERDRALPRGEGETEAWDRGDLDLDLGLLGRGAPTESSSNGERERRGAAGETLRLRGGPCEGGERDRLRLTDRDKLRDCCRAGIGGESLLSRFGGDPRSRRSFPLRAGFSRDRERSRRRGAGEAERERRRERSKEGERERWRGRRLRSGDRDLR